MKQETEDRKCILTGEVKSKDELLRFTLISGGRVIPDFKKKLPGRGIYVKQKRGEAFQEASPCFYEQIR